MKKALHLEETPAPDLSQAPMEPWLRKEMPKHDAPAELDHRLRKRVRFTDIYSEARSEQRLIDSLRGGPPVQPRRVKKTSPTPPAAPHAAAPQEWLVAQFQAFLEKLQADMAGAAQPEPDEEPPEEKPARIRPIRTPRSDAPMLTARPAELLRAEFRRGKLFFSCPCCRFPAALPVWLAGKKVRCPRCYSALRAPHPRRGLQVRALENDIESVLHPERFVESYNAHRLLPLVGLPRPKLTPSFHAGATMVLLIILCCWMPFAMSRTDREIQRLAALVQTPDREEGPAGFKDRAARLVTEFLTTEDIAARAALVRDPARAAPLMDDWYRRHPAQACAVAPRSVEVSGSGFYAGGEQQPVTDVHVELPDGETAVYTVEHRPEGDRIAWELSVGYSADFEEILAGPPAAEPRPVRVLAAFDDYYNYAFSDPSAHLCVRLHDAASRELLGYGYIAADDPAAPALAAALDGSHAGDLRPIDLDICPAVQGKKHRQVNIAAVRPAVSTTVAQQSAAGL